MAMLSRRLETENIANAIEVILRRLLVDTYRPVPLHVRMTANGRNAGPRLAEIAPEQKQVHHLLQQARSFLMLGEAHPVADHGRARADVDLGASADLSFLQSGDFDDIRPALRHHLIADCIQPYRMFTDELLIDDLFTARFALEDHFHYALQHRQVAADADVNEFAGNLRRTECRHLDHV